MDINHLSLSCEYQPLLNPHDLTIWGYEALARFRTAQGQLRPPNLVFERLHDTPDLFAQIEYLAKSFQLEHAPPGRLFVNIDPHAMHGDFSKIMMSLLKQRPQLTVEIIENTCINEAKMAKTIVDNFHANDINTALDDIGAPHAMLCLELMAKVQCLKFDRHWLTRLEDEDQLQLLSMLITYAKATNKVCILEGVETKAHLVMARKLNVDLVQGFLFKSAFKSPATSLACLNLVELSTIQADTGLTA